MMIWMTQSTKKPHPETRDLHETIQMLMERINRMQSQLNERDDLLIALKIHYNLICITNTTTSKATQTSSLTSPPTHIPTVQWCSNPNLSQSARRRNARCSSRNMSVHREENVDELLAEYGRKRIGTLSIYQSEDLETLRRFEQALIEKSQDSLVVVHAMDHLEVSQLNVSASCHGIAYSHGHLDALFHGIMDFLSCFTLDDADKSVYSPWKVREWIVDITHALTACNETHSFPKAFHLALSSNPDLSVKEEAVLEFLQRLNSMASDCDLDELAQIEVDGELLEDPELVSIYLDLFSGSLASVIYLQREQTLAKYANLSDEVDFGLLSDQMLEMQQELGVMIFDATQKLWLCVMDSNQSNMERAFDGVAALQKYVDHWNQLKLLFDAMYTVHRWKSKESTKAYDIHIAMAALDHHLFVVLDQLLSDISTRTGT